MNDGCYLSFFERKGVLKEIIEWCEKWEKWIINYVFLLIFFMKLFGFIVYGSCFFGIKVLIIKWIFFYILIVRVWSYR